MTNNSFKEDGFQDRLIEGLISNKPFLKHFFHQYLSSLNDDDWIKLWEILGRISDDSDNKINPSEDAEIFIGFYDD